MRRPRLPSGPLTETHRGQPDSAGGAGAGFGGGVVGVEAEHFATDGVRASGNSTSSSSGPNGLGLTVALPRTLRSTNAIENLDGSVQRYT